MKSITTGRNGNGSPLDMEVAERPGGEEAMTNGHNGHHANGHEGSVGTSTLRATNGTAVKIEPRVTALAPLPSSPSGTGESRLPAPHVLALFCFDEPLSGLGRQVGRLSAGFARRSWPVHIFSRSAFPEEIPGVVVHALGDCGSGGIVEQVQEFTRRACNAFSSRFPAAGQKATLLGFEWSSVPALSLLRALKNLDTALVLDTIERQRSDMSSDVSKRIQEMECTGLREARTLLFRRPATGDAVRGLMPEAAGRLAAFPEIFPVEHYEAALDPGAIKARYKVGPVDPTIAFVGNMDECHAPNILMKAVPAILKNHKQARFVFVGDGELAWPLRVHARYLLLEHAVRLVGHVGGQALNELIQAADIVCVPSKSDTEWWPIFAAWAARRPVVATHEVAKPLLRHEQNCVKFYPNENSCVWGIERVLYDAALGRAIGEQGYQTLDEHLGWTHAAIRLEEMLGLPRPR